MTNEELRKRYGPFKEIWRERESELVKKGKFRNVLTITSEDIPYEDIPEDDRPSAKELKERGETKKTFMGTMLFARVGHHLVNVEAIFESAKPMPEELTVRDFWFDEFIEAP